MSVMSNVREESVEASSSYEPSSILSADSHSADADDLSLPDEFRWRPEPVTAQAAYPASKVRQGLKPGAWLDGLYLLLGVTSVIVAVQQVIWSARW